MKENLRDIIIEHTKKYPAMEISDMVKLVFQSEFGGGHMILDSSDSLSKLYKEYEGLPHVGKKCPVCYDAIGNNLVRLHLAGIDEHVQLETVNRFFVNTASEVNSDVGCFEEKLEVLYELCKEGLVPFSEEELMTYLEVYKKQGYPAVHHSSVYRKQYHPAYRVVSKDYVKYMEVFEMIDKKLRYSDNGIVVAIDGRCGSGKSYLSRLLAGVYKCSVIHMDDFFLRPEQKTEERLVEVGGNIDYERFSDEVLTPLMDKKQVFEYQRYDCGLRRLTESVKVYRKHLVIVEGSYSCHPYFRDKYDLTIFLDLDDAVQKERILERNGAYMLSRFVSEWIPKEDAYFEKFKVKENCRLVL